LIDSIVGEYHEVCGLYDTNLIPDHARIKGIERFTIDELVRVLNRAGFDVTYTRAKNPDQTESNIGSFIARRQAKWNLAGLLGRLKRRHAA
jgi:hypothetical protein